MTKRRIQNNLITVIITVLCIFTSAIIAKGADWKLVGKGSGYLCFVDIESISRLPYGTIQAWEKFECSEKGNCGPINSGLNLWEINCATRQERTLFIKNYDINGNIHNTSSSPGEWIYIQPDNLAATEFLKVACQNKP